RRVLTLCLSLRLVFAYAVHTSRCVYSPSPRSFAFFFFNDTATTEIYTLSLHDALPICCRWLRACATRRSWPRVRRQAFRNRDSRSEEHTSELQSLTNLVCRLLLEKKKKAVT